MSQPVIYKALYAYRNLVSLLPRRAASRLGGAIGKLIYYLNHKKTVQAIARVEKYLGVSHKEAEKIIKKCYWHFGAAATEFARLPKDAKHITDFVEQDGVEHVLNPIKEGRGVLLVTAHIGNWEYAASALAHLGVPINGLGTDQRDERITQMIADIREAGGVKPLGKASDLRAVLGALQKGEMIAVPIDQDAKEKGLPSPFLGHIASTPLGVAKLAAKTGCAVVVGACLRKPNGDFVSKYMPALELAGGKKFGEDVQASLDLANAQISDFIRENPWQWLWLYPRWESVERGLFNEDRN